MFLNFDQWNPFRADYPNFNLILNLCNKVEISKFTILYNIRKTNPFQDIPEPVMLFNYFDRDKYNKIGVFRFDDFYNGNY